MKYKKQNKFHAYRGTSEEWGKKWENNGILKWSNKNNEYFGHGHYFFENDHHEALSWAYHNRDIEKEDLAVIYAYIETDNILDLLDSVTYEDYTRFLESMSKIYRDRNKKLNIKKPYDCRVINTLVKRYKFDMVKGSFSPRHKLGDKLIDIGDTRYPKSHIQLCVINKNIIKDSEVDYFKRNDLEYDKRKGLVLCSMI